MLVVLGATIPGFLIQGGIYLLLRKKGVHPIKALIIAAPVFIVIYTLIGGSGLADGGPPNYAWGFNIGIQASIIVSILIGIDIWRSSKKTSADQEENEN